ncbi:hypothetical protein [Vulcanococcus limneticus]|uniref:hypothetical protein n=1 Tax=Vulcanococcus limneticus TaxID=2170428 RepID=UPI00398BE8AE
MANAESLKRTYELKSEEKSSVVIRIDRSEAFGYEGGLCYKSKRVAPFATGKANGYGTGRWSIDAEEGRKTSAEANRVIFLSGSELFDPLRPGLTREI